jgi:hypothetical protein
MLADENSTDFSPTPTSGFEMTFTNIFREEKGR